jgi:hypothetical protein
METTQEIQKKLLLEAESKLKQLKRDRKTIEIKIQNFATTFNENKNIISDKFSEIV